MKRGMDIEKECNKEKGLPQQNALNNAMEKSLKLFLSWFFWKHTDVLDLVKMVDDFLETPS